MPYDTASALFDHPTVAECYADVTAPGSFVSQMANNTLPVANFKAFLAHDAHYLFNYNRAYAAALVKSPDVKHQTIFHGLIGGTLDEIKHVEGACARWGAVRGAVHPAAQAYIDFLEGLHPAAVPLEELIAGMTPCMRLYTNLGRDYVKRGLVVQGCAYQEWFDAYAGEEMESLTRNLEALLPAPKDGAGLSSKVEANYVRAMELERDFFAAFA
jgi:thiaminase/transcriptional activator TenA|mmetsp:Transcript_17465/g.43272  ORF Transcript_17465/g.43272 Transcript_17465/m.43272 type:complete len:214 (+) Transcript_17465:282-923(+)